MRSNIFNIYVYVVEHLICIMILRVHAISTVKIAWQEVFFFLMKIYKKKNTITFENLIDK